MSLTIDYLLNQNGSSVHARCAKYIQYMIKVERFRQENYANHQTLFHIMIMDALRQGIIMTLLTFKSIHQMFSGILVFRMSHSINRKITPRMKI